SRLRALLERRVHLFPVGAHRVGGEGTGRVVGHVHRVAAPARMNRPAAVLPVQIHHELPTSSKNAGAALRSVPHRMLRSQLFELLPVLRTRKIHDSRSRSCSHVPAGSGGSTRMMSATFRCGTGPSFFSGIWMRMYCTISASEADSTERARQSLLGCTRARPVHSISNWLPTISL